MSSSRPKDRHKIYKLYAEKLKEITQIELIPTDLDQTTPWFIDALVPDPGELSAYLKKNGIGSRNFYPTLHDLPFYGKKGKFPVSTYVSKHGLWLPSSSKLKDSE